LHELVREPLDLGERRDDKGVVLVDVGPEGRQGEPQSLPLAATPIYAIDVHDPQTDLPRLRVGGVGAQFWGPSTR